MLLTFFHAVEQPQHHAPEVQEQCQGLGKTKKKLYSANPKTMNT